MENIKKLKALKAFLRENGIDYEEKVQSSLRVVFDLRIRRFRIVVHLSDEHDDEFYQRVLKHYHPFFIRDEESVEFVIEKMQGCIAKVMMARQRCFEKKARREEGLRKHEENMKRHMEKLAAKAEKPKRKRQRIVRYEKV